MCAANNPGSKTGTPEDFNHRIILKYNTTVLNDACKVPGCFFRKCAEHHVLGQTQSRPQEFNHRVILKYNTTVLNDACKVAVFWSESICAAFTISEQKRNTRTIPERNTYIYSCMYLLVELSVYQDGCRRDYVAPYPTPPLTPPMARANVQQIFNVISSRPPAQPLNETIAKLRSTPNFVTVSGGPPEANYKIITGSGGPPEANYKIITGRFVLIITMPPSNYKKH
jgi:hypothetical protein